MHIPAIDALRHERFGIVEHQNAIMVMKAYVKTEETEERGAYHPTEGFARPFPLLLNTGGDVVCIEEFVNNATLTPFSETLLNYTNHLYQSMKNGEWVDELAGYEDTDFSTAERNIAYSLKHFTTTDMPKELLRVYESANKINEEQIGTNPLLDIANRERYQFDYLPDSVDEWELIRYQSENEVENSTKPALTDSIWLRYTIGEHSEERPLISYQNSVAGLSGLSIDVDFGTDGTGEVTPELITAILSSETESTVDNPLTNFTGFTTETTQTEKYLTKYLEQMRS